MSLRGFAYRGHSVPLRCAQHMYNLAAEMKATKILAMLQLLRVSCRLSATDSEVEVIKEVTYIERHDAIIESAAFTSAKVRCFSLRNSMPTCTKSS